MDYNIKWHEIKGLILVSFIFHYINENKLQFDVTRLVKLVLVLERRLSTRSTGELIAALDWHLMQLMLGLKESVDWRTWNKVGRREERKQGLAIGDGRSGGSPWALFTNVLIENLELTLITANL